MAGDNRKFIIVGGGPVGFAAALLLARHGFQCEVYEGRAVIPNDPQESYPIGVNPRGLHTLSLIDPALCEQLKQNGAAVDSWQVYVGPRRVGMNVSGVTWGTSRSQLNLLLAEAAMKAPAIRVHYGYRLEGIDFEKKALRFETRGEGGGPVTVDAAGARIIAADGVNSVVRREMEAYDAGFRVESTPWTYEFRVLFGTAGATAAELDPAVHYICNGQYLATVDYEGKQTWSCVTSVRDRDAARRRELFLATEASEGNMAAMRATLRKMTPWFYPLLPENDVGDAELRRYFARRTFRGAIVRTNRLHHGEWIVLLGDAAHSVLPPTGEGLNSGLEDAAVLVEECVVKEPANAFAAYNEKRIADVHALLEYASYLNGDPWFAGERIARLFFLIAGARAKPSITDYLFGPMAPERRPYSEFIGVWKQRRRRLLGLFRLVAYPIGAVAELLALPWTMARLLSERGGPDRTLKPPV